VAEIEKNKDNESAGKEEKKILRAEDIIPPFNTRPDDEENKAQNSVNPRHAIPVFDLAEEIMAEHRKLVSAKRKSPAVESLKVADSFKKREDKNYTDTAETSETDRIITEIVARDIEGLCRGEKMKL
jgi:hypothetical protein